ncbi:MAG: SIMPL domain-containing protein [Granulosicoccaceae bacterium]
MVMSMVRSNFAVLLLAVACSQITLANADEKAVLYDVYSLSANAQSEIKNDLMTVSVVAQAEGSDAAVVADSINATMAWAVIQLKPFGRIKTETRDYRTNPKYAGKPARIVGWNAIQMLQLESSDFDAMGSAIQKLQARLQVQGMNLGVKPSTRKQAEDALINEAMNAFKQRALLVQQNMGAPGYRVININIGTDGHSTNFRQIETMSHDASHMSSAPAIEAGASMISVRIDGSIQLE